MLEPSTFICRCGTEFTTGAAEPPPAWQRIRGELVCGDCIAVVEALDRRELAGRAGPTPVRNDGSDSATAILLRSGVYLDLADPDCARISASDIAAGLRQFRFAAQTRQPYTIAQHSLLVLRLIDPVAAEIGGERGQAIRRCALLHDAPEAFLHDITSPLKGLLPDYRAIEAEFEARFARAFGLVWTPDRKAIVKRADLTALAIEKRELLGLATAGRALPAGDHFKAMHVSLGRVWSPDEAEARFLDAFATLAHRPEEIAA